MRLPCIVSQGLRAGGSPLVSVANGQRRPFTVAVIGGGITGLSAAWRLARNPKCTKVVLYEKSGRLGGWLESETIPVDGGHVVFEYGPRTLRSAAPMSLPLLNMIADIDLLEAVVSTDKKSPSALNRFMYYPDHIVRMPGLIPGASGFRNLFENLATLAREPVFESLVSSILSEPFKPPREPAEWTQDESVASFISRRFHPKVADNIVSAIFHGIYAGDIDQLSAQMLLGRLRNLEADDSGVVGGMINKRMAGRGTVATDDAMALQMLGDLRELKNCPKEAQYLLPAIAKRSSTFTFQKGLAQLVDGLAAALKKSGKVTVMTNTEITEMQKKTDSSIIEITSNQHGLRTYPRVISTIPSPALAKVLSSTNYSNRLIPSDTISQLRQHNYATTVMVVNLYYSNPNLIPFDGFGYLIPRSIPFEQNPERGLGVIFASSTSVGQDTAPGTKLTVMLGGHYWDDWKESDYPDHESAVQMARTMLQRHLGITDTPTLARSRLQRDAIPQYTVGHRDRMYRLSESVRTDFDRRLVLAGNWYNGIGVPDCVKQGVLAATLGIGQERLAWHTEPGSVWEQFDYQSWDLEGGITMAPVPFAETNINKSRRRQDA